MVRLYLEGCSLSEVLSVNPIWWTSTIKAKAVAGIVLGLRFAHSLGLVHGHLTRNNILFDSDHCIQIVNFNPIILEIGEMESENEEATQLVGFSGKEWTGARDIEAFVSILSELMFGGPAHGEVSIPTRTAIFSFEMFKSRFSRISGSSSFNTILEILKHYDFKIYDDVDSAEVSKFVSWVESAELPNK
jgi:serine/threonine protein kinase